MSAKKLLEALDAIDDLNIIDEAISLTNLRLNQLCALQAMVMGKQEMTGSVSVDPGTVEIVSEEDSDED